MALHRPQLATFSSKYHTSDVLISFANNWLAKKIKFAAFLAHQIAFCLIFNVLAKNAVWPDSPIYIERERPHEWPGWWAGKRFERLTN